LCFIRLCGDRDLTFYYLWKQNKRTGSSILAVQRVYLLLQFSLKNFSSIGAPRFQRYEDTLQDLATTLQEEGFFSNPIEDDEDFIEEQEPEEEIHEESYQTFEEEQEPPHESIEEEEDLDEAHHVEDQGHDDDPIEERILPSRRQGYGKLYSFPSF
jgi:hypothetical protein